MVKIVPPDGLGVPIPGLESVMESPIWSFFITLPATPSRNLNNVQRT